MPPAPPGDPRRRSIPQARVVAMLALYGWGMEPHPGGEAPAALLDRLVAGGLPFADGGAGRLFDPAEAINRVIAGGLVGTGPAWRDRFVATARAMAGAAAPRAVSFERRFDLRGAGVIGDPAAGRLSPDHIGGTGERGRLRLRAPCPIADQAIDLSLDTDVGTATAPGRIEACPTAPFPDEVRIGWRARLAGRPDAIDRSPPDGRWLSPNEGFVRVTPAVRALADRLAAPGVDDRTAARAFFDHLIDKFACGIIPYETIAGPATDHVLASRWYDCQLGSALLAALCRARGIPARLVGGYLLWPRPARHIWCEIWLEGWQPHDLLAWDLSAGGRDEAWRDPAAGRPRRILTDIWPDIFTGAGSIAVPAAHHRIVSAEGGGVAIDHLTIAGVSLYRDLIRVDPA